MDGESLWAIRKNGWLELGFNKTYFHEALRQCGFIGVDHHGQDGLWSHAIIAKRASEFVSTFRFTQPSSLPLLQHQIGRIDQDQLIIDPDESGFAIYGPYSSLPAGQWELDVLINPDIAIEGRFILDCVDDFGKKRIAPETQFHFEKGRNHQTGQAARLHLSFATQSPLHSFEIRLQVSPNSQASFSGVNLRPKD
jgi:hypothetical protein